MKHQEPKIESKTRPTHFLAIPLLSPSVSSAVQQVQTSLIAHSPELKRACIEPETAHVTLCVLTLKDKDAVEAAKQALLGCKHSLERSGLASPFFLELAGLSDFRSSVLYLNLQGSSNGETLQEIRILLEESFQEAGITHTPSSSQHNAFTPHLTIAKMSKMIDWSTNRGGRSRGGGEIGGNDGDDNYTQEGVIQVEGQGKQVTQPPLRKIPRESYSQHIDIDAGSVECREIQLCAMNSRQPGHYYDVIERMVLGGE